MEKTEKKLRSNKRNYILALILLMLTNISMGVTLMLLDKNALRKQIDQRMLDVANSAADLLDGDEMKDLKPDDKGSESYQKVYDVLRVFQVNIELEYIYGIRQENDRSFSFTVDPSDDPAEFGAPILSTASLRKASKGTPAVDRKSHVDEWGRFYSAYSPVFDSDGNVAGIIGVDFNADWYDGKINSNRAIITVMTLISLCIGIGLSFFIMSQNRKRFDEVLSGMEELDTQAQKLDQIIMRSSIKKIDLLPESEAKLLKNLALSETEIIPVCDEYDEVNSSIQSVYKKLKKYLSFLESEIYIDNLTGAKNKAAYRERSGKLEKLIEEGKASFSVALFDINEMKTLYAKYGYNIGDKLMYECAKLLKTVFGEENVYHIIGDEFIVILDDKFGVYIHKRFARFDTELKKHNEKLEDQFKLSVSKGCAIYNPEYHEHYRQVFMDAKKYCDKDKKEYYAQKNAQSEE